MTPRGYHGERFKAKSGLRLKITILQQESLPDE
jgi:hypothetical protein